MVTEAAITGCLLGTAVGDALGLPYEGLSTRRAAKVLGEPDRYHFFLGRGMVSDDTEHACMAAQALIASGEDVDVFQRRLARCLRHWLLGLPAGIGLATLKSTLRLWAGIPPHRSGVFSAGNGPAMRSPVLGAAVEDLKLLKQLVRASTRLTHSDPTAEYGALAIALAARHAAQGVEIDGSTYLAQLVSLCVDDPAKELLQLVERVVDSHTRGETTGQFAASLGLKHGVSGYMYHTVPVVLHSWLRNQRDLRSAIVDAIRCGGDTDTTAAIVGGIVGCAVGKAGIPQAWLDRLWEWPRTVRWIEELAASLFDARSTRRPGPAPRLPVHGVLLRNAGFMAIVLLHGLRRLLPPY